MTTRLVTITLPRSLHQQMKTLANRMDIKVSEAYLRAVAAYVAKEKTV